MTDQNTEAIGGQVTAGAAIVFDSALDRAADATNTGAIRFGFTTSSAVAVTGRVSIALPSGYFVLVDSGVSNTFATDGAASAAVAKCALTAGVSSVAVLGIMGADLLMCTIEVAALSAGAQVMSLVAGAVKTGAPQAAATYNVATSVDRRLQAGPATVALGGQVTAGAAIVFSSALDRAADATNTGAIRFGFTTSSAVAVTGRVSIALPSGYFVLVDSGVSNTFATDGAASAAVAKCALTAGVSSVAVLGIMGADLLMCTIEVAALSAGAQVMSLVAGAVKTGAPQAAATYNVATSADRRRDPSFFSFFISGVSLPDIIQPGLQSVRAALVDGVGQVRSLMVDGSFPPIVSFFLYVFCSHLLFSIIFIYRFARVVSFHH